MTVLVVCLTVLIVAERFRPFVGRLVAVQEARYVPVPVVSEAPIEVPQDIQSQAAQWVDEHARTAHLAHAVDLFHEHQDWDVVRRIIATEGYSA